MNYFKYTAPFLAVFVLSGCSVIEKTLNRNDPFYGQRIEPVVVTEKTKHDTDDPAIWHHPTDASKTLIIGTDKDSDGGLYVYDLNGKIVRKVESLQRPNNVDIQYGLDFQGSKVDIAVTTERELNQLRIYALPEMTEIGVIPVFEDETERSPMGIALYKNKENGEIHAIVGRKSGPAENYLWQYLLKENQGRIVGELVRKFGNYSGKKEIEAIAVDQELGYIYYSDEQFGIHKYHADPSKGNAELAVFGQQDFTDDMEGISIYNTASGKGYILVSNQQANTFNVYRREGDAGNPHSHSRIAEVPLSTKSSDGSEVTSRNMGIRYPRGIFVAMSEGKTFHYYDWRDIQKVIEAAEKQ